MSQPRQRISALGIAMIGVGSVLLLPGLCAVFFAAHMAATEDVVRLATRDPYFQFIMVVWAVCIAVALVGVLLIRYGARRRLRELSHE